MMGNKNFGFKTLNMMMKDGSFMDMKPVWNKDFFLFFFCGIAAEFIRSHTASLPGVVSFLLGYGPFLAGIVALWIVRREKLKAKKWWSGIYFISFIAYDALVLFFPVMVSSLWSLFWH